MSQGCRYYLLAFSQLEWGRVTAAVNVRRATAFARSKTEKVDNIVSVAAAGMIGHQSALPLTDLDKRKL